jgi:hypothetical protein
VKMRKGEGMGSGAHVGGTLAARLFEQAIYERALSE